MRSRNIKPGLFKNYDLADAGPIAQLLFAGLWCMADKEGRLEDKPRLIKAELFPYYDADVNGELTVIERLGFIKRYVADGMAIIQIIKFKEHQSPHHTEKDSVLPPFTGVSCCLQTTREINGYITVNSPLEHGGNPSDSLIPDSLIPDSLIPDSITASRQKRAKAAPKKQAKTEGVWKAYSEAYALRYSVAPTDNAKVRGMLSRFVDRVPAAEAPDIATAYVSSNRALYVSARHCVDLLLRDAEGLRTEWATGQTITDTGARMTDRTQTNLNSFAPLIEAAKRRDELKRLANEN